MANRSENNGVSILAADLGLTWHHREVRFTPGMIPSIAVACCVTLPVPAGETVFLGGSLHYQEVGTHSIVEKESLGAFVERIGGIIRAEYEVNGKRNLASCRIQVRRKHAPGKSAEDFIFDFEKDQDMAWSFILQSGDVVEVKEKSMIERTPIALGGLKFPAARFAKPKIQGPALPAPAGIKSDGD
ncbi:hypothetical protein OKA04_14565 [Luteolibacter flavescens]|uniref:Uncharacterized protein n=1 Tax=Luteolibacter flavescens TaxID=1859460 RepID=A0ABT3FRN2_9BACT|nr:hypothetical protein [Luteolibacter flavescens]MCW1885959.1 hypothetical protein [Luteolibacter flavescens]